MKLTDLIGETTEYDKKEMLEERKSKSWLKSVSAFANGIGGALIFGIADDDTLVGLSDAKADADKISEKIKATLDPVPQIILSIPHEDGKDFVILKVLSGQETPYYYYADGNRIAYVRVGNESVPADAATLKRLVLHGSGISYDSLPTHFKTVDYAFTKLRSVYRARTGNELEDADFISFGLSTDDGMLTNAGALLSDECPIRHSRLFCTRWYGLDKASGVMEALDDKEFSGSLVSLLQNGEEFVKNNTKNRWKKTGQGRLEMPEYPEQAVLECIVNALIHRDYTQVGSEVHIDIFDDRMEIYSPGGMYDGSVVQDLDVDHIPSKRRNPVIADVFSRMHYMERRGSGFKRIKSDYQNAVNYRPQTAPKFYSTNTSFFVTLYNLNYGVPIGKTGVSDEKQAFEPPETGVSDEKQAFEAHIATLPLTKKTQGSILLLYHAYGFKQAFSRTDVSQILSITLSPAGELLRKMKNAGLIESVKGQGKGQYRFCQH